MWVMQIKDIVVSVTGLGYVGLPLALLFASKYKVIAYDKNPDRINLLRKGEDPSREVSKKEFDQKNIFFTDQAGDLRLANFHIIAVPTPIDQDHLPDLSLLKEAAYTLGLHIKKRDCLVLESTIYPGCTREVFIPIIEKTSGLRGGLDFDFGYSPERMNPGDKEHTVDKIVKVVSAHSEEALEYISQVYGSVISAGICKAQSIEVAEAAKIIENVQRDINIALMNELSMLFHKMDINTKEVLKVASTKWNFMPFTPGLVGGHCIGVDPYYLVYASRKVGVEPKMINYSRSINNSMPSYIAGKLVKALIARGKAPDRCKVLIMGVTFKENISDVRNSKVADLAYELKQFAIQVDLHDPNSVSFDFQKEYGLMLKETLEPPYSAVIVAVAHEVFKVLDMDYFLRIMDRDPILFDLKGIYPNYFCKYMDYFSL